MIGKSTDQASNNLLTRFTDETELGYSGLVLHVVTIPIGNLDDYSSDQGHGKNFGLTMLFLLTHYLWQPFP